MGPPPNSLLPPPEGRRRRLNQHLGTPLRPPGWAVGPLKRRKHPPGGVRAPHGVTGAESGCRRFRCGTTSACAAPPPSQRCGGDGGCTLLCQRPWNVAEPSAAAARDGRRHHPRVDVVKGMIGVDVDGHAIVASLLAPTSLPPLPCSPGPRCAGTQRRGATRRLKGEPPQLCEYTHPTANVRTRQPKRGYKKGWALWACRGTSRPTASPAATAAAATALPPPSHFSSAIPETTALVPVTGWTA